MPATETAQTKANRTPDMGVRFALLTGRLPANSYAISVCSSTCGRSVLKIRRYHLALWSVHVRTGQPKSASISIHSTPNCSQQENQHEAKNATFVVFGA